MHLKAEVEATESIKRKCARGMFEQSGRVDCVVTKGFNAYCRFPLNRSGLKGRI